MKPLLLSGARGEIVINNVAFALATDINVNVRENVSSTYVCGSINPVALDPTSIDVDVSVGRVIPVNKPAGAVDPAQISALALGIETAIPAILSAEDFSIVIRDKISNKIIASVQNCRFAGRSLGSGAEDVAGERYNFIGIYDAGYDGNTNTHGGVGYES